MSVNLLDLTDHALCQLGPGQLAMNIQREYEEARHEVEVIAPVPEPGDRLGHILHLGAINVMRELNTQYLESVDALSDTHDIYWCAMMDAYTRHILNGEINP